MTWREQSGEPHHRSQWVALLILTFNELNAAEQPNYGLPRSGAV